MTRDLSRALERHLGKRRLEILRTVADRAYALGYSTYLAGGSVRDLLLRVPHSDLDIVVEGDAISLARSLSKEHGGKVTAHPTFLTATWHRGGAKPEPAAVDVATSRAESYPNPGALPDVRPSPIEHDLRRRDFSINAMAIRLDIDRWGELLDPLGGETDLQARTIRVLHPRSFIDDPTRVFRAVRYEQRLGFQMDENTQSLIAGAREAVGALSGERLRHELDLILDEPRCAETLARLQSSDVLVAIDRALSFDGAAAARLEAGPTDEPAGITGFTFRHMRWALWLMTVTREELDRLCARLAFDKPTAELLRVTSELHGSMNDLRGRRPSEVTSALDRLPPVAVYAVSLARAGGDGSGEPLRQYLTTWRATKASTTSQDLQAAGIRPGPAFGRILAQLRAARLDGEIATDEEELALRRRLVEQEARPSQPGPSRAT